MLTTDEISELAEQDLNLLWKIAHKYAPLLNRGADELLGSAFQVYHECRLKFDPKLGNRFSTYFYRACANSLARYAVNQDSEHEAVEARNRWRRQKSMTAAEFAVCSLDAKIGHSELVIKNTIADRLPNWMADILEEFDTVDEFWAFLSAGLSGDYRTVFLAHHRDQLTYDEIKTVLGVSRSRVQQYAQAALAKSKRRVLERFGDYCYA